MFSFSSLPLLLQELILKELNPIDLFFFSLISQKSLLLAKRSKLAVEKFEWCITKDFTRIAVTHGERNVKIITLSKERSSNSQVLRFDAQIDNINFSVYSHVFSKTRLFRITSENYAVLAEVISKRLTEVLRPQKFRLEIEYCLLPLYIFEHSRTFEDVSAYFPDEQHYKNAAQTLLNEINTDYLMLETPAIEFSEHLQPLKHRKMDLVAPWFAKEDLMSFECEELHVDAPNLTSDDLQEFFRRWEEGKFPKLKKLTINMARRVKWNLNLEHADGKGFGVITDVEGNVGKIEHDGHSLKFRVNGAF